MIKNQKIDIFDCHYYEPSGNDIFIQILSKIFIVWEHALNLLLNCIDLTDDLHQRYLLTYAWINKHGDAHGFK